MTPAPPPIFTPEAIKEDAVNRVTRTGTQGGLASALVVVGEWVAHQAGWRGDLPTAVAAALVLILTTGASAAMNRARLRGEG